MRAMTASVLSLFLVFPAAATTVVEKFPGSNASHGTGRPPEPDEEGTGGSTGTTVGDPIEVATGMFSFTETDVTLPGVGLGVSFTRTYAITARNQPSPFGRGWDHNWNRLIDVWTDKDVLGLHHITMTRAGNGRAHTTKFQSSPGGNEKLWKSESVSPGVEWKYTTNLDAAGDTIAVQQDENGLTYEFKEIFEDEDADYYYELLTLRRVTDEWGNYVFLSYNTDGLLEKIWIPTKNSLQLHLEFEYVNLLPTSPDDKWRMELMRDSSGREWHYDYTSAGLLKEVTHPSGKIVTYYYNGVRLTHYTSNGSDSPFKNEYDGQARVTKQYVGPTVGSNQDHYTFTYDLTESYYGDYNKVVGPEGNERWYFTEEHESGHKVVKALFEFETPGDLNTARQTWYTYNSSMALTGIYHPGELGEFDGRAETYGYDTANADPHSHHNMEWRTVSHGSEIDPFREQWNYDGRRILAYRDSRTVAENIANQTSHNTVSFSYTTATHPNGTTGLPDGSTYVTEYTKTTRPVTLPDGAAQNISETWKLNAEGQIEEHIDPRGIRTLYSYNDMGLEHTITVDADGIAAVTTKEYDAVGNLKKVTDPEGRVTNYTINTNKNVPDTVTGPGNIAGSVLPSVKNLVYTFEGHLESEGLEEEVGPFSDGESVTEWTYDLQGYGLPTQVVRDIDASNRVYTRREYDALGRVTDEYTQATDQYDPQLDRHVSYTYDHRGLVTTATLHCPDPNLNVVREFTYNHAGRRETETIGGLLIEKRLYDPLDRLWKIERRDGTFVVSTTEYVYDENGNVKNEKLYNSNGLHIATFLKHYDEANRVWKTRRRYWDANHNPVGSGYIVSLYYRDEAGNIVREEHDDAPTVERQFDGLGRVVKVGDDLSSPQVELTEFTYDKSGFLEQSSRLLVAACSSDNQTIITTFVPDDAGRVKQVSTALGTSTTEYDKRGRKIRSTSPEGVIREWLYDEAGNVRIEATVDEPSTSLSDITSDPNDVWTEYTYDGWGRLSSVIRHDPSPGVGNQQTAHEYDAAGRRCRTIRQGALPGDLYEETYTYDARGNLETITDSLGTVTTYSYGPRNERLSAMITPGTGIAGSTTYQWEYTDAGLLKRAYSVDPGQAQIDVTRTYNSLGSMEQETIDTVLFGSTSATITTTAEYDNDGRLKKVFYPSGLGVRYKYDAHSRPDRIEDLSGGTLFEYEFLGATRIHRRSSPHIESYLEYGGHGLPFSVTYQSESSGGEMGIGCPAGCPCPPPPTLIRPIYAQVVGYDGDARSTYADHKFYDEQGTLLTSGANIKGDVPEYNTLGRTVSIYENVPSSQMGPLNPLNPPTGQDRLVELAYERRGLRKTRSIDGVTDHSYANNSIDELTQINTGPTWQYDKRGCTTQSHFEGTTTDYTYDAFGQLLTTTVGADQSTYRFDALGRRIALEKPDGKVDLYAYWEGRLIELFEDSGVNSGSVEELRASYVYRPGDRVPEALKQTLTAAPIYLLKDVAGGITVAARDTAQDPGTPIEQYRTDWFGVPRVFVETNGSFVEDQDARSSIGNQFVSRGAWVDAGTSPRRIGLAGNPILVELGRPLSTGRFSLPLAKQPSFSSLSAQPFLDSSPSTSSLAQRSRGARRLWSGRRGRPLSALRSASTRTLDRSGTKMPPSPANPARGRPPFSPVSPAPEEQVKVKPEKVVPSGTPSKLFGSDDPWTLDTDSVLYMKQADAGNIEDDGLQPGDDGFVGPVMPEETVAIHDEVPDMPLGDEADMIGRPHQWIETPDANAGLGNANGVPGVESDSPDAPGTKTYVVDHSKREPRNTTYVAGVDIDAVNSYLKPGERVGNFMPFCSDCNNFVDNAIKNSTPGMHPTGRNVIFRDMGGIRIYEERKFGVKYSDGSIRPPGPRISVLPK